MTVAINSALVLHYTNHILRVIADLFASSTFDRLANRYANWYNLRLIASLLNFEGRLNRKKISLHITAQETLDDLMIANLTHHNLELKDLETYVSSRLSIMTGINHRAISITQIGEGQSKLFIPIITRQ